MRWAKVIDHDRCIGCHACSVACKQENGVPLGSFRTWVKYVEKGTFPEVRRHFAVLRCNQCDNAPCVKICPTQAIEVRSYADFVPLGASATPMRATDSILWTVKFRNGTVKRFKFPIRTTPEGKAAPDGGYASPGDLNSPLLFTEPESIGMNDVFRLKN